MGVPASYTLSVQNTGTAATTAVSTITDTIPTGLTIGTLPAGCTAAGQTVTCTIRGRPGGERDHELHHSDHADGGGGFASGEHRDGERRR